jgi:guanylate kinase
MPITIEHKGMLIVLSAPSGGGKSTVLKSILDGDDNIEYSVSVTSRKPRKGEVNGKSYHFVSADEFKRHIDEERFLEWAVVHNHYYGTRRDIIEEKLARKIDIILDLDFQGGLNVKKQMPDSLLIFLLPPSMEILEKRLRARNLDDEETIMLRLRNAAEEIEYASRYDYIVVNDSLEETIFNVKKIIEAERFRSNHVQVAIENEPKLLMAQDEENDAQSGAGC